MGVCRGEAAALGEMSSGLDIEPRIGGAGIREIPPDSGGDRQAEGSPRLRREHKLEGALGMSGALGFAGKVWGMQISAHGGEGAGLEVGLKIEEGALGTRAGGRSLRV